VLWQILLAQFPAGSPYGNHLGFAGALAVETSTARAEGRSEEGTQAIDSHARRSDRPNNHRLRTDDRTRKD